MAGGDSAELCLPRSTTGDYTFGNQPLANRGQAPVTITAVSTVGATGVEVVDALVVPVGSTLLGAKRGWPPRPDQIPDGVDWTSRTPAVGSAIPPGQVRNLVLHLKVDGDGHFDFILVRYSDPTSDHTAASTTKVQFRMTCF